MENLISAKEILNKQKQFKEDKLNNEIKRINDLICSKINTEQRYVEVSSLSNEMICILKKFGYVVKCVEASPIEYIYKIIW